MARTSTSRSAEGVRETPSPSIAPLLTTASVLPSPRVTTEMWLSPEKDGSEPSMWLSFAMRSTMLDSAPHARSFFPCTSIFSVQNHSTPLAIPHAPCHDRSAASCTLSRAYVSPFFARRSLSCVSAKWTSVPNFSLRTIAQGRYHSNAPRSYVWNISEYAQSRFATARRSSVSFRSPPSPSSMKMVSGYSSRTRATMYSHVLSGIMYPASQRNPSTPLRHQKRNTSAMYALSAALPKSSSTRSAHLTPHAPGEWKRPSASRRNQSGWCVCSVDAQPVWFAGRSTRRRPCRACTASMSSRNWSSGVVNSSNSAIAGSTERKSVAANGQPYSPITAYVVGTGNGGRVCTMRKPILSIMTSSLLATSRKDPNWRGKTV